MRKQFYLFPSAVDKKDTKKDVIEMSERKDNEERSNSDHQS